MRIGFRRIDLCQIGSCRLDALRFGAEIPRTPLIPLVAVLVETVLAIAVLTCAILALLRIALLSRPLQSCPFLPAPDWIGAIRKVSVLIAALRPAALLRIALLRTAILRIAILRIAILEIPVLKTAIRTRAAVFRPVVGPVVLPGLGIELRTLLKSLGRRWLERAWRGGGRLRRGKAVRQGAAIIILIVLGIGFARGAGIAVLGLKLRQLRCGNQPEIMFGMLQIALGHHWIARRLRIARQLQVFFRHMMGGAANLDVGSIRFEGPR